MAMVKENFNKTISIRLTENTVKELDALAEKQGLDRTMVIRDAIRTYLRQNNHSQQAQIVRVENLENRLKLVEVLLAQLTIKK